MSRCLNSPGQVLEKTRERVLNAVKDLGYSPNFGARALAAKRTNTIGAIIPTMENSIFARGLQAFQEELGRNGVTLLVASSFYRQDIEEEQIHTLAARGADGLLLIGHDRTADAYAFMDQRGIPYLISWAYDASASRASIGFDNRKAMEGLALEVIDRGHRRIGIISAPQATNDRARNRVEGVIAAMSRRRIEPETLRIVETDYSFENGAAAFRTLMSGSPRPTAIMCGNDVMAIGALDMAREMGLRVPEDVSITGFDDLDIARIVRPRLTTVHVPHREMGREAARMLIGMVKGDVPSSSRQLETTLMMRETLATCPK